METSAVTTQRRETTDDELELIEMRYRQALALRNIEDLFAEGQLDCGEDLPANPPRDQASMPASFADSFHSRPAAESSRAAVAGVAGRH